MAGDGERGLCPFVGAVDNGLVDLGFADKVVEEEGPLAPADAGSAGDAVTDDGTFAFFLACKSVVSGTGDGSADVEGAG